MIWRIIIVLLLFISCKTYKASESISGKYFTYIPNIIDKVKLEIKHKGQMEITPLIMIYLRKDFTYVVGGCDNQISEIGRYSYSNDSLFLFDRYNLVNGIAIKNMFYFLQNNNFDILLTMVKNNENSNKSYTELIPMRKDWLKGHYGFLRGEEMSYDSLKHHYERRSIPEQQKWSDSFMIIRSTYTNPN